MIIVKVIIIVNTIIPVFACISICRALLISHATQIKIKSLRYELSEDKKLYEKATRFYMLLVLMSNTLWFMWNVSRIVNNWTPYASMFITVTSILFSLILFLKARLLLMFHRGNGAMKYFKKFNL